MLNVGIIGLGVGYHHYMAFKKNKNCNVFAICEFNQKKFLNLNEPKIKFYTRAIDLISDQSIDIVSIASYDHYHYEQILLSLKNNKHVFVEKPLCLNSKQLEKINKVLKSNKKLIISSNLNLRTEDKFQFLKKEINNKKLGKIYNIQASYLWGRSNKIDNTWRNKKNNYSFLLASGTHIIDLVNWLIGTYPKSVYVTSSKNTPKKFNFNESDFFNINFKYKDGLIVNIFLNALCIHPHFHPLTVFGTKKTIIQNLDSSYNISKKKDKYIINRGKFTKSNKKKKLMIDEFIKNIKYKKSNKLLSYQEIYYLMKICFACIESIKKSKEVEIVLNEN